MTEIQPYIPPTDSWVAVIEPVGDLANKIADTDFVPKDFRRKPAAVAAAIMYGREIGLQPMSSLRSVNVIHGTPSLESEAMRALILSHGHHLRFVETTATRCIMEGCRRGSEDWTRVAYTMDEANQSGDAKKNPNYRSRPQEMMIARATSRLARMVFADVIGGLATPEEIDTAGEAPPQAPPQTVTVKQEKPKAVKSRSPRKAKTETPPPEDGPQDGPPLPGEPGYNIETVPVDTETGEIIDAEVVEDSPEDKHPEPITDPQMRKMQALLRALEVTDRDERRRMIGDILGHPLESAKDLTKDEASMVIDTLDEMTRHADG
jgi:hypothetical protein